MALFIGTSLGKCLRDILNGTVQESEVLVIVANIACPTIEQLNAVVEDYHTWSRKEKYDLSKYTLTECVELANRLFNAGKIHQPRTFNGARRDHNLSDTWYDIVPTLTSTNQSVVDAYNAYRMISILAT